MPLRDLFTLVILVLRRTTVESIHRSRKRIFGRPTGKVLLPASGWHGTPGVTARPRFVPRLESRTMSTSPTTGSAHPARRRHGAHSSASLHPPAVWRIHGKELPVEIHSRSTSRKTYGSDRV